MGKIIPLRPENIQLLAIETKQMIRANALGIPLIAIDSLTALKEIAAPRHPGKTICAMIDARRKEVFSAVFDGKGELIKSISADILDEGSYSEYEPFVFVGDGAAK
ncbi:MAG: tRNA threonylcarbamoyladenosine biosynthesis protein TsaB, partial [Planctomyces sp.]